jgi:urea transport system permease protein
MQNAIFASLKNLTTLLACLFALLSFTQTLKAEQLLPDSSLPDSTSLEESWNALSSKNYNTKSTAIENISKQNPAEADTAFKAILDGKLYYSKRNKQLFIMLEVADIYNFTPLLENQVISEKITQKNKRGFKKVRINNRLRSQLRQIIAVMQLKSDDANIRLAALHELLKNPQADSAQLINAVIDTETNASVLHAMQTLLAITDLNYGNLKAQEKAIQTLSFSLNSSAMNALNDYQPADANLKKKTQLAIKKINEKRSLYAKAETIFFGLSMGSVLALSAIGLAITFGVMGVINMAHGELMMIGAYTTYVVQLIMPEQIGLSVIVAIPSAFIVSGLVGIAIERGVIRHLYGRPLETLLATFGVSLILQQTVRSIFSPLNRSVETPQWMSGAWQINDVLALTWNRLYIIIFCLLVFISLILVMKKTLLGLQVRAVSQNRSMARAMGVRSEWVDALTFGLGSGIAGLAGVALSLLTNVGPNLGQAYIIDSFMVVVFGGVGNLWGTLVAGMSLGVINKILEPWAGAVLAKIIVLIFIILFIQKRPKGLFPQRGRASED